MGSDEHANTIQPARDSQPTPSRSKKELQRILISQPMLAKPYDSYLPPQPVDGNGQRIQVTAFYTEHSEIVERWQFSDTDIRWYRLELWKSAWVAMKIDKRTPVT